MYKIIKKTKKLLDIFGKEYEREKRLCNLFREWVIIKIEKKEICDYLWENGYREVALYGMNYVGEILLQDLGQSEIKVKYAIDKNAKYIRTGVTMIKPDEKLPEVDMVIVTAIAYFDEIKDNLSKKISCPIVSLEDILSKLL